MKKLNGLLACLLVITASLFILTLSQNIIVRSAEVYAFYFNDSRCVSQIHTTVGANEMADEIAEFMNTWRPSEFQVEEDTGYDKIGIFTEKESDRMLVFKRLLDYSSLTAAAGGIFTVVLAWMILRNEGKKAVRRSCYGTISLTLFLEMLELYFMTTNAGRERVMSCLGLKALGDESALSVLISDECLSLMAVLMAVTAVLALGVLVYVGRRLTKPVNMFY